MGRQGIRRRKRRRPLGKVHGGVGTVDTPPVMWPEAGSGFEASPYSPAGQAQTFWRFAQGATHDRGRPAWVRITVWVVVVGMVTPFAIQLVVWLTDLVR